MPVLLAFAAAMLWGLSTFLVARMAASTPSIQLTFWSQTLGLGVLLPAAVLLGGSALSVRGTTLGFVAGLGAGTSLVMLYASLRVVAVGIAATISGAVGTIGPVAYALASGMRPGPTVLTGVAVTVLAVAILMVLPTQAGREPGSVAAPPDGTVAAAGPPPPPMRRPVLGTAVAALSGLLMTVYYVALDQIGEAADAWTAIESRLGSAIMMLLLCLVLSQRVRLTPHQMRAAAWVGVTGALGAASFILAIGAGGSLVVVVPIAVLSPAVSVLLARMFLHERMTAGQTLALLAAGAGVVAVLSG